MREVFKSNFVLFPPDTKLGTFVSPTNDPITNRYSFIANLLLV